MKLTTDNVKNTDVIQKELTYPPELFGVWRKRQDTEELIKAMDKFNNTVIRCINKIKNSKIFI